MVSFHRIPMTSEPRGKWSGKIWTGFLGTNTLLSLTLHAAAAP